MEGTVEPWTWPVIWLVFVTLFMINPLPIMSRESRWWTLRKMGRILTSGFHRVDVRAFYYPFCCDSYRDLRLSSRSSGLGGCIL